MQAPISSLHAAARSFAEAGIPVFPCVAHGKAPATDRGFHDATTDVAQIDAWWTENPNYNLALSPQHAGWGVLDFDGQEAEDAIATYEQEFGSLPETYEVRTPRGGRHLYFAGELPTSSNKLARKIDTRGVGGYILLPPSYVIDPEKGIDGPYEVLHDRDIAPAPDWIAARLRESAQRVAALVEDIDEGAARTRARSLLLGCVERGDVAVSGSGGNDRTYRLACELHNLGLTPATSRELLEEVWNPHCVPPWSSDELEIFCENATRYAQNEAGAWATAPAAEVFAGSLDKLLAEDASKPARRSRFYPEDDDDMDKTPDQQWLFQDIILVNSTVLVYGKSQSYKSFIALATTMSAATGVETLGWKPLVTGPAFYCPLEGRNAVKRKRRVAWRIAHGVEGKTEFYVMPAPMLLFTEEVTEFMDELRKKLNGRKPSMIVFDTVSKVMAGLDPTRDAPRFIRFCDRLTEEFGCAVVAIGHSGHDEKKGMRDSSAYHAGFDTVLEMKGNHKKKITTLTVLKHKDAEEPEHPYHFQGRQVGPSLVFFPVTADEAHAVEHADDPFERKKIGKLLQELNAYGAEQGVTTAVLAAAAAPGREGDSTDEIEEGKKKAARALGSLARKSLEAYCEKQANGALLWFLPTQQG